MIRGSLVRTKRLLGLRQRIQFKRDASAGGATTLISLLHLACFCFDSPTRVLSLCFLSRYFMYKCASAHAMSKIQAAVTRGFTSELKKFILHFSISHRHPSLEMISPIYQVPGTWYWYLGCISPTLTESGDKWENLIIEISSCCCSH